MEKEFNFVIWGPGGGNGKFHVRMFEKQVVILKSYTAAFDDPSRCEKN